ncbi:aldose 1-epimerase family protein [Agathobacter sp.]
MDIKLENDLLEVTINSFGAELSSITGKETGTQYLWDADEKFWKRSAPVLFPFVGSLKDKKYTVDGKDYPMGQHGFARDMEFSVVSETKDEAWFELRSNDDTLAKFPFEFVLKIGYRLDGKDINVTWHVENPGDKELLFSIGGHPAFMCPVTEEGKQSDYYLKFDADKALTYGLLSSDGLLDRDDYLLGVDINGYCPIDEHMFDKDALIIEHFQASKVSLCTPDKKPYLTVKFDAPLFGLWSPAGKGAPFVCIEPWYGRCDRADFSGELKDREYGNVLAAGEIFEKSYDITIE